MIITKWVTAPPIETHFSPYLLDPLLGFLLEVQRTIMPKAKKKIRPQDVKKRRMFDQLHQLFMEMYERKKDEEALYKEKIREAMEKMPGLPLKGKTCTFSRIPLSDADT